MSQDPKSKDFDPYSAWLGIAPGPRPPTPADLLGIAPGESNADRILAAAMERKKRLDGLSLSEHSRLAAHLAGEVAAAMALLMNRAAKPRAPVASPEVTPIPIGADTPEVPIVLGRAVKARERALVVLDARAAPDEGTPVSRIPPRAQFGADELTRQHAALGQTEPVRPAVQRDASAGSIRDQGNKILHGLSRLLAVVLLVFAVGFGTIFLTIHLSPRTGEEPRRPGRQIVDLTPRPEESGFVSLFDGNSLDQWDAERGIETWKAEGGAIVARPRPGQTGQWLFSREDHGDYTLRLEIRLSVGAQCLFAFRADPQRPEGISLDAFLMVVKPLADLKPRLASSRRSRTESALDGIFAGRDLVTKSMPTVPVSLRPQGSWNDVELKAQGPSLHISVNGRPIPLRSDIQARGERSTDHTAWGVSSTIRVVGRIGFRAMQDGDVRLRNIRIKE